MPFLYLSTCLTLPLPLFLLFKRDATWETFTKDRMLKRQTTAKNAVSTWKSVSKSICPIISRVRSSLCVVQTARFLLQQHHDGKVHVAAAGEARSFQSPYTVTGEELEYYRLLAGDEAAVLEVIWFCCARLLLCVTILVFCAVCEQENLR